MEVHYFISNLLFGVVPAFDKCKRFCKAPLMFTSHTTKVSLVMASADRVLMNFLSNTSKSACALQQKYNKLLFQRHKKLVFVGLTDAPRMIKKSVVTEKNKAFK
jgi:hypothetical protein